MILEVGRLSTPTVCDFSTPYSATIGEIDIFRPIPLLDTPYHISGGAALDADNVPLGCLPIALLYENSTDTYTALFDLPYDIRGGEALSADSVPFSESLWRDYLRNIYISNYGAFGHTVLY